MQISDELAALIQRAESAITTARLLVDENNRLRRNIERQLDHMFEIGVEFARPPVSLPANPHPPVAEDKRRAARSGYGDAAIRSGSA
ncbi:MULTISPECIES: hypothetical protein [unclassified Bradyrhizobium]|uniref:hypothetical protein n=1 Tax=unclassified Bradyrhizobium TaxID=2631580 RepID=UPI002479089D|nr:MULTISPECIES: hypothetical protein [unclassified Bradyrhizobium]WGR68488.1 hypothetical protein MTX24_23975 [Bradyrhizobium sp. ISRA426]WGR80543.1 hypothetical protein MTX21_09090 [Bradyrhizobium sp. ISRA430]WGR83728.1 hypothetical protein MTX25_23655 [Bradyrhizobium sp. ISRA432]